VVTNGVYSVTGHEQVVAEKATILGPCLVGPLEAGFLHCRVLDVELENDRIGQGLSAMLVSEVCGEAGHAIVAFRGGFRWTPSYEPVRLDNLPSHALRNDGCYLITGGLGGLGFCFAQYLSRSVNRPTLVVMGRTKLPEPEAWSRHVAEGDLADPIREKLVQLLSLRDDGATVLYVSGDVAQPEDVRRLSEFIAGRSLVLRGIFHAAGVADGGGEPDEYGITPAIAPKLTGTRLLLQHFNTAELDFVLLCSSVAAIDPIVGQTEYSAANAFLDAVAAEQRSRGLNIVAVNWSTWQSVGMAVAHAMSLPKELREQQLIYLSQCISPQDAPLLFQRLLAASMSQVVVTPTEFGAMLKGTAALNAILAGQKRPPESSGIVAPRPSVQAAYVAPSGDLEEGLVEIWQKLFGIAPIGINDNFFDLGGHSLLATQLVYNVNSAFGVELRLRDMLEHPTIGALASKIEAMILAEISAMSESEVQAHLSEGLSA
jgi:NAD(P)-dependent dehydrogenase (short-subunit alcohol dehydrogenase family)/acyl carrier protein